MALNFQQPNFDPNEGKKRSRQEIRQAIQGIPSLMFQYEELKRKRELEDRDFKKQFGEGGDAPSGVEETPEQRMNRIGLAGYNAETNRMNASRASMTRNEVPFYLDDKGKAIDALTGQPITTRDSGVDYTYIRRDDGMEDIRAGNLEIRRDSAINQMVQQFKQDKRVVKAYQALDSSNDIHELVLSGNPIAAAAIPTYSARMSGEVGNLSEPDKKPFGGTRAILGRIEQSLKQMADGTLTEDNRKFMIELTSLIKKRAYEKINSEAMNTSKQKKGLYGLKESDIYEKLYQGPDMSGVTEEIASISGPAAEIKTPPTMEPDVEAYSKKYGISYEEALAIKNKRMGK